MKAKAKKRKNPKPKDCFTCDSCIYVGEGDHWCDETHEIVIEDFIPNENYLCCLREKTE